MLDARASQLEQQAQSRRITGGTSPSTHSVPVARLEARIETLSLACAAAQVYSGALPANDSESEWPTSPEVSADSKGPPDGCAARGVRSPD